MTHEMTNEKENISREVATNSEQEVALSQAEPVNASSALARRPERTVSPKASIYDSGEDIALELEMPGASRDSIDIQVHNDELVIYGARRTQEDSGYQLLHQERVPFNYRRTFILSDRVDSANIAARFEDGVLRLRLPKVAEAKPRRITIE